MEKKNPQRMHGGRGVWILILLKRSVPVNPYKVTVCPQGSEYSNLMIADLISDHLPLSLLSPIIARTMLGTKKSLKLVSVLASGLKDAEGCQVAVVCVLPSAS